MVIFAEEGGQVGGNRIDQFAQFGLVRTIGNNPAILIKTIETQGTQAPGQTPVNHVAFAIGKHNPGSFADNAANGFEILVREHELACLVFRFFERAHVA